MPRLMMCGVDEEERLRSSEEVQDTKGFKGEESSHDLAW